MSTFMYKNEQIGGLKPKAEDVGVGESDISSIGDGSITGAISTLEKNKANASDVYSKEEVDTLVKSDIAFSVDENGILCATYDDGEESEE